MSYSFFSQHVLLTRTYTRHVWSHTPPLPDERGGTTLMLGNDRLPAQTSAELLPLLLCSLPAVCTQRRAQIAASPLLPAPGSRPRLMQKGYETHSPALLLRHITRARIRPLGRANLPEGIIPWHPCSRGRLTAPAGSCCLCFGSGHASSSWRSPKSLSFPCDCCWHAVLSRGWRGEEQIKERKWTRKPGWTAECL